jgi:hypothetical protein
MRKMTNVVAALVVSLTMSSVASASVITTGTLDYDNVSNVITDNVSGETYLGWDMVKDLDYAQTVAITTGVGLYSDWHIASQTEAYSFYTAAAGTTLVDVLGPQQGMSVIGDFVDGGPFGESFTGNQDMAFFLGDEAMQVGTLDARYESGYLIIRDQIGGITWSDEQSRSPTPIGWLLVGGTTTAVPEPSIIALFGLGLVGIGFARRRRQA